MAASVRVPDVVAGRVGAVFIAERAFEDDEFLAARVSVPMETAARRVADNAGRNGGFLAVPVEQAALHAGRRRWHPGEITAMNARVDPEVGMEFHRAAP